jgi:cob(I)alamin adenosyltransferase
MIFIFTGNGKGKTTSAIGMGVRSTGAGNKVLMIQFLKVGSSENKIIQKIHNFDIKSFGRKGFFVTQSEFKKNSELEKKGVEPLIKRDLILFGKGFSEAKKAAELGRYQLLILDEIIIGLKFKLINNKGIIDFLKKYGKKMDIILTGRYCPKGIIKIADLVTEMKEIKHPFKKGIKAKRGIEY